MSVTIQCRTRFDITRTDTRGYFQAHRLPVRDQAGQWLQDSGSWHRSRNQQRNLDTVMQIIALRVLPESVTDPVCHGDTWSFRFTVPNPAGVAWGADPVGALRYDANAVPMVADLGNETQGLQTLNTYGDDANIWFDIIDGK